MSNRIVFYGSYSSDRMGIRLAQFVVDRLRRRSAREADSSVSDLSVGWHLGPVRTQRSQK